MNKRGILFAVVGTALLIWGLLGFVAAHWGSVWVGHYENGISYDVVSRSVATIGAAMLVAGLLIHRD
jgi:hypothetical protein